jgi:hypothetical protein
VAEQTRTKEWKALRLACGNADGLRDRKLELEQFLVEPSVDTYFLNENYLQPGCSLNLRNNVSHRTDRPTPAGGRANLVRRDIQYCALRVSVFQHIEAIGTYPGVLAKKPLKLMSAYFSPTPPLIKLELTNAYNSTE